MSFTDIKNLRKDGNLKEAYHLAKQEMVEASEAGNSEALLWAKRGMCWVLYDYIKDRVEKLENKITQEEVNKLIKVLKNVQKLNLSYDENLFYEQLTWKVAQALKAINKLDNENERTNLVKRVFKTIEQYDLSQFQEPYNFLLIQLHNALKADSEYLNIIDWWGTNNLKRSDFEENEGKDGKRYSSLAEQIYTSYSKQLVEARKREEIGDDKIELFLKELDIVIKKHAEYKFLLYRKAQLLLELDREQEAIKSFLPFVRRNNKQTWVWELLGDMYYKEPLKQLACYCKALTIKSKEEFINKIRIKLAALLINKSLWDEAKTEIDFYYDFRIKNGWKVYNQVNNWMTSPWYSNASSLENNNKLYKEKSQLIDKLLYEDLPETIVVVDYVNEEKKILNFLLNRYYRGFFNYSQFDVNPKVGQVYKVKMKSEGDEGYHNVYSMSEKDNERASDLFYNFIGNISIHKGNSFGIIDGKQSVFVTGHQIKKYQLSDGDTVNGLAIANYDKKKKVWGWRLINVNE